MSKYLFYVAFLYFCWYAGNKAFPPTAQQPAPVAGSGQVIDLDKYSATANNAPVQTHTLLNSKPGRNNDQENASPSPGRPLLHINSNITSSHNLFILPTSNYSGQANFKQHSLINNDETQSLSVVNGINN